MKYSREFQARTTNEVAMLPQRSVVAEMLSDYAGKRELARACGSG